MDNQQSIRFLYDYKITDRILIYKPLFLKAVFLPLGRNYFLKHKREIFKLKIKFFQKVVNLTSKIRSTENFLFDWNPYENKIEFITSGCNLLDTAIDFKCKSILSPNTTAYYFRLADGDNLMSKIF